jgi:type I restriction enzyme, S subunit
VSIPRYPKYKDSGVEWLGEVPEHWEVLPLNSLASERDEPNVGMIEENLLSLSYGRIVRKDAASNDGLLPESFETYQIIRPGDIVLRLTDLQNDKRSLRSAFVEEVGIITSAYVALAPRRIHARYLSYLLRAYDTTKVFYSMGGGLRQSMKFADLKGLGTLLPPQTEQAAIAVFLDGETEKIDALAAEQQRLIDLLKEKRQAVISHAVTKGLNPDASVKTSGIEWLGDLPAHWNVAELKRIAAVRTGVAKGKDNGSRPTLSVPYLRVANVQDGYLDLAEVSTIEIPFEELDRYVLQPGDVLMNEGGDFDKLGRGHIWEGQIEPCITQNHVFAVRPRQVSSVWLNAITGSSYAQFYFMSRSKQSTNLASISSTNLMELPVVLPPADEQQVILGFVAAQNARSDTLIAESERAISLLQERRTALISAAVTGKIDIRGRVEGKVA